MLIQELRRIQAHSALQRKLLVGRTRGGARELLRQLARAHGSWTGFEPTTVRPVAVEIAERSLGVEGLVLLDEFDVRALIDDSIDHVLARGAFGRLTELADRVGLRERIYGVISALRLGGIGPKQLAESRMGDRAKREALTRILQRYEASLENEGAADTATVLALACTVMESGASSLQFDTGVYLLPELSGTGLTGRLVRALEAAGAMRLQTDPVVGLPVPEGRIWAAGEARCSASFLHSPTADIESGEATGHLELDLFAAAGVGEELREVLRRVMTRGVAWDDVEIVTPDPAVYGSALHAICERLELPVTFGVGLPLGRTRPGRAVVQYFRWIEGGFPASELRVMLEKGDLRPAPKYETVKAMTLARRFRSLRVGWGRERYSRLLREALASTEHLSRGRYESERAFERRRIRTGTELRALRSILSPVLRATPPVPHPTAGGGRPLSPADLAAGLQVFLRYVPADHPVDVTAKERLLNVLTRVGQTLTRRTDYPWAAAALRHHLDFRVSAPRAEGKAPWSSDGGHLFLTDIEHGGRTGRPVTFLVGMDAGRFPGGGLEDPLLLDSDRTRFAGGTLPTAGQRLDERRFELAALVARLRGELTVSYPAWEPAEARALAPSAAVLQAYRLAHGDSSLTFRDLRTHLGSARGVLARTGTLDGLDVWMRALAPDGRLLRGTHLVRRAFPALDRGLEALEALDLPEATPWVGMIQPRAELDPRVNPERVLSASRLESLGQCPRRYFFQSVLSLRSPDDFVMDPDVWLDPLKRGTLLHSLYEQSLRKARDRELSFQDPAFEDLVQMILADEVERARLAFPAPSSQVAERQIRLLEEDARSFVAMVRREGAPWLGLEVQFGLESQPAVRLPVPGGEVTLRGVVDRVDQGPDGLVVVDYKTGSTFRYGATTGVFNEGRRLQHVVYVAAVGRLLGRPVVRMEYHFPTRKAENRIVPFPESELRLGPEIMGHLLDGVRDGAFLPTDDPDDCRFCDFQHICRVRVGQWGAVQSPLARWAAEHRDTTAAFQRIAKARNVEAEGDAFPGFLPRVDGQP